MHHWRQLTTNHTLCVYFPGITGVLLYAYILAFPPPDLCPVIHALVATWFPHSVRAAAIR